MRNNSGTSLLENPVILILIAAGCVGALSLLGSNVASSFTSTTKSLNVIKNNDGEVLLVNNNPETSSNQSRPYDFGFGNPSSANNNASNSSNQNDTSTNKENTDNNNLNNKPQTDSQHAFIYEKAPGKDYFEGSNKSENFVLTNEADLAFGNGGKDTINAGAGNDKIYGGTGDDILYGKDGNDIINSDQDNDTVYGGNGNDYINAGRGDDTINGQAGNDIIHAQSGNDTINGGEGNDELHGNGGEDIINGGDGDDTIYGDSGDDTITTGLGNDIVYSGDGEDTITIDGNSVNRVYSGNDADTIICDSRHVDGQQQIIVTGKGNDTIQLSSISELPPFSRNNVYRIEPGPGRDIIEIELMDFNQVEIIDTSTVILTDSRNNKAYIYGFDPNKDTLTYNGIGIYSGYSPELSEI